MKKVVSLVSSAILAILFVFGVGNVAFAHESDGNGEDCGCPIVPLEGAERNKEVASVLKSKDFKEVKAELEKQGYKWLGAGDTVVVEFRLFDEKGDISQTFIMAAFIFEDEAGNFKTVVFTDGKKNSPIDGLPPF